jgi:hypothetical protein
VVRKPGSASQDRLPTTWSLQDHLLWGKRLFNHGDDWEAHEAWGHSWLELGRTSRDALIVKGLIKLAASAVKCRELNAMGATRYASRAAELLRSDSDSALFHTCSVEAARESAGRLADTHPAGQFTPSAEPIQLP